MASPSGELRMVVYDPAGPAIPLESHNQPHNAHCYHDHRHQQHVRVHRNLPLPQNYHDDEVGAAGDICATITVAGVPVKVCLDNIINGAKALWQLIKDNRPTFDLATDYASMLPCIINDKYKGCDLDVAGDPVPIPWTAMSDWKRNSWGPFKIVIETSGFPYAKQFECTFDIVWEYNGKLTIKNLLKSNSTGTYLDKIQVVPNNLWMQYGVTANMNVLTTPPKNVGSVKDPVASTTLEIELKIAQTLVTTQTWKCIFEFDANGLYKKLACGNITPPPSLAHSNRAQHPMRMTMCCPNY